MSDTQSLKSEDSTVTTNGGASIFVEIESVGKLSLADSSAARVSTASQPYPGGPDQKKFAIQDGLIGKDPINSWSISHILIHEFFCLDRFGSYG